MGLSWTLAELVLFLKPTKSPHHTFTNPSVKSVSEDSVSDMGGTPLGFQQSCDSAIDDMADKPLSVDKLLESLRDEKLPPNRRALPSMLLRELELLTWEQNALRCSSNSKSTAETRRARKP